MVTTRAVYETAKRLGARVLIVKINEIEKILYIDGRIYIIQDGKGVVRRKLWPREIENVRKRLRQGDFYWRK